MDAVLSFDSAEKDYGTKKIGPISFSIGSGEIVGLLGPNGSGKSTSIRLTLGLVRPTSGSVRLMGLDPIDEHVRALSRVGYSPELPNLQTFLTPRELLELVGRELALGRSEIAVQIPRLLESVGLRSYMDYKIGKLSKGMVQRLSVAQAMMGSPTLLILDEPMIGIDPAGVVHFRSLFRDFVRGGGTIMMSSHIMSEVESLCTSLVLVHSGRLLFRGPIEEFIHSSLNTRTVQVEIAPRKPAIVVSPPGAPTTPGGGGGLATPAAPETLALRSGLNSPETASSTSSSRVEDVTSMVRVDDALLATVRSIDGVVDVKRTGSGFIIEVEKGRELRSEISRRVVQSGAGLLSIGYPRTELDDAYVASITRSGG